MAQLSQYRISCSRKTARAVDNYLEGRSEDDSQGRSEAEFIADP